MTPVIEEIQNYFKGPFYKPVRLSQTLAEFCGSQVMSLQTIILFVIDYIKTHNLNDILDKRSFTFDETLKKAFCIEKDFVKLYRYPELQILIKTQINKIYPNPAIEIMIRNSRF